MIMRQLAKFLAVVISIGLIVILHESWNLTSFLPRDITDSFHRTIGKAIALNVRNWTTPGRHTSQLLNTTHILAYVPTMQHEALAVKQLTADTRLESAGAIVNPIDPIVESAVNLTTTVTNSPKKDNPLILFYSGKHGDPNWGFHHTSEDFQGCPEPYNRCLTTADKSRFNEADMILFESIRLANKQEDGTVKVDYWRNSGIWPNSSSRPHNQVWTFFAREPQFGGISGKDLGFARFDINYTVTFQKHADLYYPYGHKNKFSTPVDISGRNFAATKDKTVLWIVSNCYSTYRMNYYKELAQFITIDMFGGCNKDVGDPCNREKKCEMNLRSRYKFYLSFENHKCRDYITEKFWKALSTGVVPIAMGAAKEDYENIAPPHSYIHVDDFDSPKALSEYLHKLDNDDVLYNKYHAWRSNYSIGWEYMNCNLCRLATEKTRKITDITESWNSATQCTV